MKKTNLKDMIDIITKEAIRVYSETYGKLYSEDFLICFRHRISEMLGVPVEDKKNDYKPHKCSVCGYVDLYENDEEKKKAFLAHLDRSAKIVDSWPEWKQMVLGGWAVENVAIDYSDKNRSSMSVFAEINPDGSCRVLSKEELFKKKINDMEAT